MIFEIDGIGHRETRFANSNALVLNLALCSVLYLASDARFDMHTETSLDRRKAWGTRYDGTALLGLGARWSGRRADLLFASKLLRSLRGGLTPSARALEWSGFVEHWMVVTQDDVCLLTGTVWRLPLSLGVLVTPLLAIDPIAGWALAFGEWLTIGTPRLDVAAAGIHPEEVAERAARWLERKLGDENPIPS
jgi:hypothetical protein